MTLIFEKKDSFKTIDLFSCLVLIIGGSFKFIEPFFYFIDNRNTYFMLVLLLLTSILVFVKQCNSRTFNLRISLLIISAILLVIGEMGIPYSICLGVVVSTLPIKKALKILLFCGLFLLFFDFLCFFLFDLNSQYFMISSSGEMRVALGFNHPNSVAFIYLILLSGFIMIIDKHKIFYYGLLSALALFIFHFTKSRTFIFSIALCLVAAIPTYFFAKSKKMYLIIPSVFIIFTIISIVLGTVFNIQVLNDLLSGRPYYYNLFIENGTVAWISGRFLVYPEDWYLDNLFLTLIYMVGMPVLIISIIGAFYLFFISKKVFPAAFFIKLSISFLLLMIASISESYLTSIYNPAYVVLIVALLKNSSFKEIYTIINKVPSVMREWIKILIYE